MSQNWMRVPTWLEGHDDTGEVLVAVWLLGRWHRGADVTAAQVQKQAAALTGGKPWGWDRAARFTLRLHEWALENGAQCPAQLPISEPRGKAGSERGGLRGKAGRSEAAATPVIAWSRGDSGSERGANGEPRARAIPYGEREERETEKAGGDRARPPERPATAATPARVVPPRSVEPAGEDGTPGPVRLPDGREVPGDIPALLPMLGMREWGALGYNGVPDTRRLLRLTPDELRHSKGIGGAIARAVLDELARQRIPAGCFADQATGPPERREDDRVAALRRLGERIAERRTAPPGDPFADS